MKLSICHLAITSALLVTPLVTAQEGKFPCDEKLERVKAEVPAQEVKSLSAFTPATIKSRKSPTYPKEAARHGREGWVRMSYVIDEEGNVVDPVVEDFGGDKAFRRKAIAAIKKWKFNPAIKDGEPTQSCQNMVQLDFVLSGPTGATRQFASTYREIHELVREDKAQEADEQMVAFRKRATGNRYENAYLWSLDSMIANALKDENRELDSLFKTLASSKSHDSRHATFDEEYYQYIHQRLFILSANAGRYAEALDQASTLAQMGLDNPRYLEIKDAITTIESRIASEDNIFVPMLIQEEGNEFHRLVRSKFAFADIEGSLDTVEVRCDSHREIFTVAEGNIWNIPESWGACQVLVEGDEGTKFDLVEVGKV